MEFEKTSRSLANKLVDVERILGRITGFILLNYYGLNEPSAYSLLNTQQGKLRVHLDSVQQLSIISLGY
ncbi:MAG: hypothetical protein R3Y30_05160 [Vibrio sp.]